MKTKMSDLTKELNLKMMCAIKGDLHIGAFIYDKDAKMICFRNTKLLSRFYLHVVCWQSQFHLLELIILCSENGVAAFLKALSSSRVGSRQGRELEGFSVGRCFLLKISQKWR
jgi:hypothetical protein